LNTSSSSSNSSSSSSSSSSSGSSSNAFPSHAFGQFSSVPPTTSAPLASALAEHKQTQRSSARQEKGGLERSRRARQARELSGIRSLFVEVQKRTRPLFVKIRY
jgi:hypothetical protein